MGRIRKPKPEEPPFNTRSCKACNELDTIEMVQCDKCDKYFHFSCVNVDASVANREWMCNNCIFRQASLSDAPPSPFLPAKLLIRSPGKSKTTSTVTTVTNTPPLTTSQLTSKVLPENPTGQKQLTPTPAIAKPNEAEKKAKEAEGRLQAEKRARDAEKKLQKEHEKHIKEMADLRALLDEHVKTVAADLAEKERTIQKAEEEARRALDAAKRAEDENGQLHQALELLRQTQLADNDQLVEEIADDQTIANQVADDNIVNINVSNENVTSQNSQSADAMYSQMKEMLRKLIAETTSSTSIPQPHSAPVLRNKTSPSGNVFDEAFSIGSSSRVENPVEQLTQTMRRQYLPKLPSFNGNIKEWSVFEHTYNQTTLQGMFSPTDNVARLREALKPPASQLVMSLILYSSDANRIMEELREAYGKPEDLIAASVDELLELPNLTSQVDPGLRTMMILVRNYVATLDNLKAHSEVDGVYTLRKIIPKLHHQHQTEWHALKREKPNANLRDFAEFLVIKVKQIPNGLLSAKPRGAQATGTKSQYEVKHKRVNTHQQASSSTTRSEACFKCNGTHKLYKCQDFLKLSTNSRWDVIKKKQVCSSCLQSTLHRSVECQWKRECGISGCNKMHNKLLHNYRSSNSNGANPIGNQYSTGNSSDVNPEPSTSSINIHRIQEPTTINNIVMPHFEAETTLFKIVPITLSGKFKSIETFAFLDDGSQVTLLEQGIFDQLHLGGTPQTVHLKWSNGIVRKEKSFRTEVTVAGLKSKHRHTLTNVSTVKGLDLPSQTVDAENLKKNFSHLRGLPIPTVRDGKPMILIGLNHPTFLNGKSQHSGGDNEPIACKTRLGWAVYGPSSSNGSFKSASGDVKSGVQLTMSQASRYDEDLNELVKGFFSVENFGIMPPKRVLISEAEKRATNIMNNTLQMVDGRYEIGLLWKSDNVRLPDSWPMAMSRLRLLEKSLRKKPSMLEWKNNHVKELLAKGYARVATADDLRAKWERVWYCPTFITVNPNKIPPKPRDVCDVAATVKGESLNSNLLKGPDNMAPLMQALFKFRENFVAVNADVREMFHQVIIKAEDQQCQRFLWRDGDETRPPTTYIMQRMMFGPTCSPACAQFIKNFHASKYEATRPEAAKAIKETTYVDDYFNSHPTHDDALRVVNDAIEICKSMGFQLVGFQSNDPVLLKKLPKDLVKSSVVDINSNEGQIETAKLLGVVWQPSLDVITYRTKLGELENKMINTDYRPTKREMLRTLMRIFDPLGLVAHYLIRGKIVLQEVWREGTGWDEQVSTALQFMWQEFIIQMGNISLIQIPRHYAPVNPSEQHVQLIVFVDASEKAFAAVSYFRFSANNEVHIAQVMGKAKVAPIKRLTIPQLELQAALLGARMAMTIQKMHAFKIHEAIFLSDSRVVLAWVSSKTFNFKTFVASRVGEILESTKPEQWFHVGTKDNVADDATKHTDPQMGNCDTRWFCGPEFLSTSFETWPIKPAVQCEQDSSDIAAYATMVHLITTNPLPQLTAVDEIKPRFKANWDSLVRVTAFVLRFSKRCKTSINVNKKYVTPEEFSAAENIIFKKIQREAFGEEIRELESKSTVSASSRLMKFSPYLDDGVIRMRSRAQRANISFASKNPPILPNKHELVDVFINYHHKRNFHMGEEMTIADVRERAWVIDVRSAVKRCKRNCQWCKNQRAKPQFPQMADLHVSRVDFGEKPFTNTGLDAFGPYLLKRGRSTVKRYGLIFTCLTYRAVHLEVLDEMTTNACILAIRRFLVRRGGSKRFHSDNGKNFHGANNLLHKEMREIQSQLESTASIQVGIVWKFIPAYSPWFGGAWERLIQSVKKCIEYTMKDEEPNESVFQNALIEAEFWMNRRPLTHTPIDHEDAKPLTPNSVLFGDEQENLAKMLDVYTVSDKFSSKMHRRSKHLVDKFHSRWVKEYLPQINRRDKWHEEKYPLKCGDVVIITEPMLGKDAWKKGRVVKIHPGPDGTVRAADVILADKTIAKNRSTGRLAVLDVLPNEQDTNTSGSARLGGEDVQDENATQSSEKQQDPETVISKASDGPGNVA